MRAKAVSVAEQFGYDQDDAEGRRQALSRTREKNQNLVDLNTV